MIILVSGAPGSGKTTLAKELSKKLGCKHVSVTELVVKEKLYLDVEKDECGKPLYVVDMDRLQERLEEEGGCLVVEGVVVDFVPPEKVKKVLYLQAPPKVLIERMESKGYCKEKICSNLEAELVGAYLQMLRGYYGDKVVCLRSDMGVEELLENALRAVGCERFPCTAWGQKDFEEYARYCL
ncbi:MAG: AAA family ATPase [Crenarchaeota archaeon]|nr:AAA family ATPase [Thermoproteota archaeon]